MTLLDTVCGGEVTGGGVAVAGDAVAVTVGRGGGVSDFGVSVIRSVLGCVVLFNGEPVATTVASGVPGRELSDSPLMDGARDSRLDASGLELVDFAGESFSFSFAASGVVSIFSFPGGGRFDVGDSNFCSTTAFVAGIDFTFASSSTLITAATFTGTALVSFFKTEAALLANVGFCDVALTGVTGCVTAGALPLSSMAVTSAVGESMGGLSSIFNSTISAGFFSVSGVGASVRSISGNNPGGKVGVARRGGSRDCPSDGSSSANTPSANPLLLPAISRIAAVSKERQSMDHHIQHGTKLRLTSDGASEH
jgi:hypothetical protein